MRTPVEVALRMLEIWYDSWGIYRRGSPMARRAALKWKTKGLIEHDRHLIPEQKPWMRRHG